MARPKNPDKKPSRSRKKAEQPAPPAAKPARWPTLRAYQTMTGVFRPRPIRWSNLSVFAMSPYTMGVFARFCVNYANFSAMIAGGVPDLGQKFAPPDAFIVPFRTAYNLVGQKWLTWGVDPRNPERHDWIEFDAALHPSGKKIMDDATLDRWEKWLADRVPDMDKLHADLTGLGVHDVVVKTVSFDDFREMPPGESFEVIEAVSDKMRVGGAL